MPPLALPLVMPAAAPHSSPGRSYWRGLEELADSDALRELIEREFPGRAGEWTNAVTRRQFLTLMGASLALAGLTGCSTRPAPAGKIVPYVRAPEELVPGRPLFFATAMTLTGIITGLLVESHEGRPTKIEGNPDHPESQGATSLFAQASILGLYDPDRSQTVTHLGRTSTWAQAAATLRTELEKQKSRRGAGLRILTETVGSPSLAAQLQAWQRAFPEGRWHQYEPLARDAVHEGARLAFGEVVATRYDFRQADVVLSLDADFFQCGPGSLRYVRDFMSRRREGIGRGAMNRLYVVESTPSGTGAKADHRLPLPAMAIPRFAQAVAVRLGVPGVAMPADEADHRWLGPLVKDLQAHRGRSIVLAGEHQPARVHALAHAMNLTLGNVGQTVFHTAPIEAEPSSQQQSLVQLLNDIDQNRVSMLVILGGNPVYTAPADLRFAERFQQVPFRLHLSLYQDETSRLCHWHVPEAHYLESWSDGRGYDGTVSLVQPLIAPLYDGKSAHELLSLLTHQIERPGYDILRDAWHGYWEEHGRPGSFEAFWERALHDGIVAGTASEPKTVTLHKDWFQALRSQTETSTLSLQNLELNFRHDPTLYDGRFANNGWLQELPKPLTKLTWDNAVLLNPTTAEELGLGHAIGWQGGEHGEVIVPVVELHYRDRPPVKAPVFALPGQPRYAATIHLGHGRTHAGRVGSGTGFNAYALRTSAAPWSDTGLTLVPTAEKYRLACTQYHQLIEVPPAGDRHTIRAATLPEYQAHPDFATLPDQEKEHEETKEARLPLTLYPGVEYPGYKWGMAIDLTACVGCAACVVACQAENNIPIVGKEEVLRGREMHWLRIDRYYHGADAENPETYFQPVPCMHCENAPCELVCPVGATVHSHDGLNDMVYNRCVGTRYCSNNCPYKVRRFNFFQYSDYATESLKLLRNPDVTVRSRGVMEKCTYCVQRLRSAEIRAKTEDRAPEPSRPGVVPLRDGEVQTACQAACPASAIVFGDLNDPTSQVVQRKAEPLNYGLLSVLNTQPRTTYLAALRNPNPELERT